jgi:predicted oxidoreductase
MEDLKMQKIKLADDLELSRIVHGQMRLSEWGFSKKERLNFIEKIIDLGITSFDHADIYGDYRCEELFGEALALKPEIRKDIQLITKCGIKLISKNRPEHKIKSYDTSKEHIISSVENSLENLKTDYLDLLLIHRPDPLMDPDQVAEAFKSLKKQGKVLNFGVSNFEPAQFDMLSSSLDFPLVTNQIEVSVMALENFENGSLDKCLEKGISPMAWSPLAGGSVFNSNQERAARVRKTLVKIKEETNAESIAQLMYAWILKHPANIIPIVGSGKINRIKEAVSSLAVEISREQWFEILQSSRGREVK